MVRQTGECQILINQPLDRTRYIKTWGMLNPGFSVCHTVSEAECKTVQCMDSGGSSIKNQDCRDTSKVGTWNGWTIEGKCWCDLTHWISVRVRSSAFRRTAICGNSFTYSQKFCEWHTLVFESQAQNRVHVETALISLRQAVLCATGGRHLRR